MREVGTLCFITNMGTVLPSFMLLGFDAQTQTNAAPGQTNPHFSRALRAFLLFSLDLGGNPETPSYGGIPFHCFPFY